ncbi:recombinase family protein [Winogradskyella sp. PAMC22761]|nr:recombinase family protein [Winogradskyella sp. PAMC22761]
MLAIYTRLSRESDDSTSIENQKREAVKFAKSNGYDGDFVIYDEGQGVSGGLAIYKRPKFEEMLKDMKEGLITAVYTRKQDRLERNIKTWGAFLEVIQKHDIKVFYSGVLQDLLTAEGKMLASIMSSTNTYLLDKQSFLTKRALHGNLEVGKSRGGIMAYGFTKDENKFVIIDEEEAEVVRDMYNMCLEGKGTRAIATILNDKGIKTRYQKMPEGTIKLTHKDTGKVTFRKKSEVQWAQNTIRNILRNEIYIGRKYFGKGEQRKIYDYPVIIDEPLWHEVQTRLNSNKLVTGKKIEHRYLLKGILECGRCGRNYYGKINSNTNIYMCSSKRFPKINCKNRGINITSIERYVWERFFELKDIVTPLKEYIEHRKKEDRIIEINNALRLVDTEIEKISEKRKRAIKFAIDGVIPESEIMESLKNFDKEVRDFNFKKKNYESQMELFTNSKKYLDMLNVDLENLNDITFKKKQELVKKYIKRIFILYDNIIGYDLKIRYTFGHEVHHVIDKNYLIGLDLNSRVPMIFDDRMDGELIYNQMVERLKRFDKIDYKDIFE